MVFTDYLDRDLNFKPQAATTDATGTPRFADHELEWNGGHVTCIKHSLRPITAQVLKSYVSMRLSPAHSNHAEPCLD